MLYPGIRTDITRIAEETVVNLKELESRIEVLKGTLSVLCQNIGHPAAAQLALSPARSAFSPVLSSMGAPGLAGFSPVQGAVPSPFASQGLVPPSAFGQPFGQTTPWAAPSFGTIGLMGQSPYASVPNVIAQTPLTGVPGVTGSPWSAPLPTVPPFGPYATQFLQQTPYGVAQNPYFYR